MPKPLADPSAFQDAPVLYDQAKIHELIPQRHEMALLQGILHHDADEVMAVGYHDPSPTDFWVRGHIPGRPLMPGIVMVEAAAQLCAFLAGYDQPIADGHMFGFGGLDEARFRGQVKPEQRLLIMAKQVKRRRSFAYFQSQAWVEGNLVYEGVILGVTI